MSSGVIVLQRPYISFSSPLVLILRWEIPAAAVMLFLNSMSLVLVNVYNVFIKYLQVNGIHMFKM